MALQSGYNNSQLQQFVPSFSGVAPLPHLTSGCDESFTNFSALLFFCGAPGALLILREPSIQGLWLEVPDRDWADTGLLGCAGNGTSVVIKGGSFLYNYAGTPVTVFDSAARNVTNATRIHTTRQEMLVD